MTKLKAFDFEADIPTLHPHNHASNLHQLDNGDLLCVWFSGSREGKPDISIVCSRLKKGEQNWSVPVVLSDDAERSEQNPILFKNTNGELWLIYTAQNNVHQESSVVRYRVSKNEGHTWSDIKTLFDKPGTFVRNQPVILEDNVIVLPAYYSLKSSKGFLGNDFSVVKISKDHGRTWEEYEVQDSKGLVHMSIVQGTDGNLIGFFRSRKSDYIYRTTSADGGKSWSTPEPTELMNNNASVQATKLRNGNLAIVFDDVNAEIAPPAENRPPWFDKSDMDKVGVDKNIVKQESIWGVERNPLSIAISEDDGQTWKYKKDIMVQEDVSEEKPEFSYPSIKQLSNGEIHITFTFLRQNIKHVVITEEAVKN
ncbi:sialidase family protein [Oceanobacillus jeddahense]|uniref:sialidase family protein n=1 Tax=Oceanobacillus jeddahense TaxID=1462527 RepID=UPI000595E2CB|nr:sialidase family protein [Oceanobacillus jeddahense]